MLEQIQDKTNVGERDKLRTSVKQDKLRTETQLGQKQTYKLRTKQTQNKDKHQTETNVEQRQTQDRDKHRTEANIGQRETQDN